MNKTKMILIMTAMIMAVSACRKVSNNNPGMSIQDYPIAVGDKWVYQVTDQLYSTIDTQTILVTQKYSGGNDSVVYKTQTLLHSTVIDSSTITISANACTYSGSNAYYALFYALRLQFPMTVNSGWHGSGGGHYSDTIEVLYTNQDETVLNTKYTNCYEVRRQERGVDNNVIALMYVVPHIGIVYQNISVDFGYPVKNQVIRLIDYSIQ